MQVERGGGLGSAPLTWSLLSRIAYYKAHATFSNKIHNDNLCSYRACKARTCQMSKDDSLILHSKYSAALFGTKLYSHFVPTTAFAAVVLVNFCRLDNQRKRLKNKVCIFGDLGYCICTGNRNGTCEINHLHYKYICSKKVLNFTRANRFGSNVYIQRGYVP